MREVQPGNGSGWAWLLGIIVGVGVFAAVASLMPGAGCADGWASDAIGRRGACSHHGGVTSGWGWLGVPAGLFAGVATVAVAQWLATRLALRRRESQDRRWERTRPARVAAAASPVPGPVEDTQSFLRRVIATDRRVTFQYRGDNTVDHRERTVRPRWIQMADEAGEHTLCLVGDCSVEGQRKFALSRMEGVRAV